MSKRRNKICSILDWWGGGILTFDTLPSILGTGTPQVGTTSVALAIPAVTVLADQIILSAVATKRKDVRPIAPTTWRKIPYGWGQAANTSGGTDAGPIGQTLILKTAVGGESGSTTSNTINANGTNSSVQATTFVIAKDPSAKLHVDAVWGAHNTPNTTAYSARAGQPLALRRNDLVLVITSVNVDGTTWSAQALAMTGITFTTVTQEIFETGTSTGEDVKQFASLFRVTGGSATGFPVFTATASAAAASNPLGITHFVRLRQETSAQVFRSGSLNDYNPAWVENFTIRSDDGVGNGLIHDYNDAANLTGGTYNGVPVYNLDADFRNALSSGDVRLWRQEVKAAPDKPALNEGAITNWGFMFFVDSLEEPALGEIIMQAHTGSAPGASSSNHPIIFFEIIDDTTNPTNNGGALRIKYGMNAVDTGVINSISTYVIPQINGQYINMLGTKQHYFRCEACWHRTTGYFYVWYKDSTMSEWVQIVNATNVKMMADTAPELGNGTAGTGSNPLVGPHIKVGPYCYNVDSYAAVVANRTAPYNHRRLNMMLGSFKIVETLAGEDEISDRTKAREDTTP